MIRIYKKNLASGTIREPGIYESNVFLLLDYYFTKALMSSSVALLRSRPSFQLAAG